MNPLKYRLSTFTPLSNGLCCQTKIQMLDFSSICSLSLVCKILGFISCQSIKSKKGESFMKSPDVAYKCSTFKSSPLIVLQDTPPHMQSIALPPNFCSPLTLLNHPLQISRHLTTSKTCCWDRIPCSFLPQHTTVIVPIPILFEVGSNVLLYRFQCNNSVPLTQNDKQIMVPKHRNEQMGPESMAE